MAFIYIFLKHIQKDLIFFSLFNAGQGIIQVFVILRQIRQISEIYKKLFFSK